MKVPLKRKGNVEGDRVISLRAKPSMKVPPKRKGNPNPAQATSHRRALNESPSEKEGKFTEQRGLFLAVTKPSMKVPPKRKGNADACDD